MALACLITVVIINLCMVYLLNIGRVGMFVHIGAWYLNNNTNNINFRFIQKLGKIVDLIFTIVD